MVTVAIDEGPLHGPRTGIGNAVAWLIEALHDVPHDNELISYVTSLRARPAPPTRRMPLPALLAHRLWARSSHPRMDRWLGRPDLVHGTNYVVPPTACPRLVSVYDTWFLDHPGEAGPDVARAGQVLRRSVAEGAHVVTSSEATGERVRALLGTDRVTTVHLGPPPAAVCVASRPPRLRALGNDPFVLSLGTLERRKNIPVLIGAFDRLTGEDATARLVIAGADGDDAVPVTAALDALGSGAAGRVHRLGRVDDREKHWLLRHATALAYPSVDEGFGFPVLEAQAAGTAVVASSAGSIPEIAGSGALLSLPTDALALAANLHLALTDETRRSALVAAGHRNLERFSWRETAEAHHRLYERIAGS